MPTGACAGPFVPAYAAVKRARKDQVQPEQAESKDQKLGEAHAEGLEQAEMHQLDSQ